MRHPCVLFGFVVLIFTFVPVGCATMPPVPESAQGEEETTEAPSASAQRAGRNPMSWPVDPEGPHPPPAEGVTSIRVPSLVYALAAEYRLGPEARKLMESGVEIRAMDATVPRLRVDELRRAKTDQESTREPQQAPNAAAPSDPASSPQAANASPPAPGAPPALAASFLSIDYETNISEIGFMLIPADPIAAAGPNHLVNVANVSIRFHQKNGTVDFTDDLATFFGAEIPDTFTFDPKVVFDPLAGRFVVVTLELEDDGPGGSPEVSEILLAVSDDADPNGTWCTTTIPANATFFNANLAATVDHWADYPGLATDEDAIYITNNMFSFSATGQSFGGVRLWVVDKGLGAGGFYDCGPAIVGELDPYAVAGVATTTQPAQIHGVAPTGVGTFLTSYSGLSNGIDEFVQVVRIDDPLGLPILTQEFINIGNIEDFASFVDAPQDDTAVTLETNDRRALDAEWFDDSLFLVATISPKSGDTDAAEITAHWWELDTSSLGSTTLTQQGNIFGDDAITNLHTFFPSVAVNGVRQVGFGYSGSASTIYPSSFYTVRTAGDAAGSTRGTATLHAGTDFYDRFFCGSRNRWGDYSGSATDPVDGCFWFYNKQSMSRGRGLHCNADNIVDEDGRWSTGYGKVCPSGACAADMFLQDISMGGTQNRNAASRITTGSNVTVASGANVTFRASDLIVLGDGFKAIGDFTAEITGAPCP